MYMYMYKFLAISTHRIKLEELKDEQRLAKANRSMHKIDLNIEKVIELFNNDDGTMRREKEWDVLRSYKGNIVRRLERHLEMLLRGSRIIALIGRLEARGAVSEASCVAVTREILSLMYKACAKGNAQRRSKSGDLTDEGNSMDSADVDAAVQVVMMWFRRMFQLDARKQSSLHGTKFVPQMMDPKHKTKSASASETKKSNPHDRRGSLESYACALPPSPHKRRRSQPAVVVSPVHGASSSAAAKRAQRRIKGLPHIPMLGEKDPMVSNEKSKSSDSVLFGMGQFPSEPPTEEEEHDLRIAFMSFIIKVIPPVSTQ
jgi:hypothetical protein